MLRVVQNPAGSAIVSPTTSSPTMIQAASPLRAIQAIPS